MTGEQGDEETGDHHKSPYRPGDEGLLFLLIFGLRGILEVKIMSDLDSEAILHTALKTDLFSYCRWFGPVAIFAGASGF